MRETSYKELDSSQGTLALDSFGSLSGSDKPIPRPANSGVIENRNVLLVPLVLKPVKLPCLQASIGATVLSPSGKPWRQIILHKTQQFAGKCLLNVNAKEYYNCKTLHNFDFNKVTKNNTSSSSSWT